MPTDQPSNQQAAEHARHDAELITRRGALTKIGAGSLLFALPAALAACGGSSTSSSSSGTGGTSTSSDISGTLNYFGWEGEDFASVSKPFLKAHNVKVNAQSMASFDDAFAKLQGGSGGGLDLIGWTGSAIPRAVTVSLLQPIDESRVPNLKNLFASFKGQFPGGSDPSQVYDANGNRMIVPTYFGSQSISYDAAVVKTVPTSWLDVLQPQYKGKVGLYDDAQANFVAAAQVLGMPGNQVPKAKMSSVFDLLGKVIDQAKSVSPSIGDLVSRMVSGDVVIAWLGYPGMDVFAAQSGKKTIKTALELKEGAYSYVEGLSIPKGASNLDTIYAYMNQLLEPRTNAAASASIAGGIVVDGAGSYLPADIKNLYPYAQLDQFLKTAPVGQLAPLVSDQYVTAADVASQWTSLTS